MFQRKEEVIRIEHIQKLSTTLIRPDGNTTFYGDITNPIGFIHNMFQVHNKNWKYVFKSNAFTNSKWWVGNLKKMVFFYTMFIRTCI